jgi:hypothetical protein
MMPSLRVCFIVGQYPQSLAAEQWIGRAETRQPSRPRVADVGCRGAGMLCRVAVTPRHIVLAAGAVLVLGMTIYLVREVGRAPAEAQIVRAPAAARQAPSPGSGPRAAAPPRAVVPEPARRSPEDDRAEVTQPTPAPVIQDDVLPATITKPDAKLDAIMGEANKAYDRGDFDEAKAIAQRVLAKAPSNVRMLRILVSSDCITGDNAEAQKNFLLLPIGDRAQMRTRCERYGVTFPE